MPKVVKCFFLFFLLYLVVYDVVDPAATMPKLYKYWNIRLFYGFFWGSFFNCLKCGGGGGGSGAAKTKMTTMAVAASTMTTKMAPFYDKHQQIHAHFVTDTQVLKR